MNFLLYCLLLVNIIFILPISYGQEVDRKEFIKFGRNTDVRFESSIPHDVLDNHFSGVLQGTGKTFLEVQEHYNISATFLAGIAILESGNGMSNLAKTKNNVFGLKGKSFDSVEECIWYIGYLFADSKFYFKKGRTTIEKIQKVYAPTSNGRNRKWVRDVIFLVNKLEKSYN